MEEANITHEDILNAREETETLETNEETESLETDEPEKVGQFKDLQSAIAQKEHFRAKAEKAEAEKKALEERLKGYSTKVTGDPLEAVRLGKALAQNSEEETDAIITYAKGKFNTLTPTPEQIIQASKDEWVTTAITARRVKVEGENKTPEPSSPSSIISGKTSDDIGKMDSREFGKFAKDAFKGGRSGI